MNNELDPLATNPFIGRPCDLWIMVLFISYVFQFKFDIYAKRNQYVHVVIVNNKHIPFEEFSLLVLVIYFKETLMKSHLTWTLILYKTHPTYKWYVLTDHTSLRTASNQQRNLRRNAVDAYRCERLSPFPQQMEAVDIGKFQTYHTQNPIIFWFTTLISEGVICLPSKRILCIAGRDVVDATRVWERLECKRTGDTHQLVIGIVVFPMPQ